jgi:competence CoiA-like predicted nuclease
MQFAILNNERILATETGQRAICPCCEKEVISKCGEFVIFHWSHKNKIECDSWYENKSKWHIDWQNKFDKKYQEIIVKDEQNVKHIADVLIDNLVIEFQHSPLSYNKIIERTEFYLLNSGKIIWVFDHRDTNIDLTYSKKTIFGMNFFTYDINSLSKPIKKFIERNDKELISFNIDNEYNELYFILNKKYGFKTNIYNSILRIENVKIYLLEIINELHERKKINKSLHHEKDELLKKYKTDINNLLKKDELLSNKLYNLEEYCFHLRVELQEKKENENLEINFLKCIDENEDLKYENSILLKKINLLQTTCNKNI